MKHIVIFFACIAAIVSAKPVPQYQQPCGSPCFSPPPTNPCGSTCNPLQQSPIFNTGFMGSPGSSGPTHLPTSGGPLAGPIWGQYLSQYTLPHSSSGQFGSTFGSTGLSTQYGSMQNAGKPSTSMTSGYMPTSGQFPMQNYGMPGMPMQNDIQNSGMFGHMPNNGQMLMPNGGGPMQNGGMSMTSGYLPTSEQMHHQQQPNSY